MQELSTAFVILMGIGTVFVGLICIIGICKIMSFFCMKFIKETQETSNTSQVSPKVNSIPNKRELIAVISAVVAEELGANVKNIRIHSIEKR